MSWYKVTFSVREMADGRHRVLCNEFNKVFTLAGAPRDAGLFSDADVMLNAYYFSPGAAAIAMPLILSYAGAECGAPSRSSLRHVAAHDEAGNIPFST